MIEALSLAVSPLSFALKDAFLTCLFVISFALTGKGSRNAPRNKKLVLLLLSLVISSIGSFIGPVLVKFTFDMYNVMYFISVISLLSINICYAAFVAILARSCRGQMDSRYSPIFVWSALLWGSLKLFLCTYYIGSRIAHVNFPLSLMHLKLLMLVYLFIMLCIAVYLLTSVVKRRRVENK